MSDDCDISFGSCQSIQTENLEMRRVAAKFVPRLITVQTDYCAKSETTVLPQPPYCPDLAPADFFLFPKLKFTLKGRRFDSIDDIKKNSQEHLRDIPKEAFQTAFRSWKQRWERCIVSKGEYFEGDSFE